MTEKQLSKVIETLGLINLGDAILYLDEEGYLEAALSTGPLGHGSHEINAADEDADERRVQFKNKRKTYPD